MEFLKAFIRFFLPPKSSAPEEAQLSWRYKIASSLGLIILFLGAAVALSCGQFPTITEGFAMVDQEAQEHRKIMHSVDESKKDIADLKQTLTELRQDQLDTKLYDIRGRQCTAIITKNRDALNSEGARLRETLPRYRGLTGEDWRIPPCAEY